MSIEEIIKAWKTDEDASAAIPANPVGEELSDDDLQEVVGGMLCRNSCGTVTCSDITEDW